MKLYDDNLLAIATKAVQFFHYQFLYTCIAFSFFTKPVALVDGRVHK